MLECESTEPVYASRDVAGEGGSAPGDGSFCHRHRRLLVWGCLLFFVLQAGTGMWDKANAWDEVSHFGSGYMAVLGKALKQDHHPMFSKTVAALPLLLYSDRLRRPEDLDSYRRGDTWMASYELLYKNTLPPETLLRLSRLPGILWGLLLGWVIYLFARDLYGWRAGLLAVFLFACCPNLLAHAGLVTLDFPVTVFMAAAGYFFYRSCKIFSWSSAGLCSMFTAMAITSKISAGILLPTYLLLLALKAAAGRRLDLRTPQRGGSMDHGPRTMDQRDRERIKPEQDAPATFSAPCPMPHAHCPVPPEQDAPATSEGPLSIVHCPLSPFSPHWRRLVLLGGGALAGLLAVWVLIWAAYGFRYDPIAADSGRAKLSLSQPEASGVIPAFARLAWEKRLLPQHFISSLQSVGLHLQRGHLSYLRGEFSTTGWWWFFPYAMAVKTPPPTLLLALGAALGTFLCWRRLPAGLWRDELFVVVPAAVFLGAAMAGNLNIGLRHVLPVYPALFILGSKVCALPLGAPAWRRLRPVLALLCCWAVFEVAHIRPHYLAYFNVFAGGPGNGHRHLIDSNLDWGQDLPGLKREMARLGIDEIKLSYFGTASPDYYGINYVALPSYTIINPRRVAQDEDFKGWYAISATMLSGGYMTEHPEFVRFMRVLRDHVEPVSQVGYSIYIYRLDGL